jgi:uncharacterized membrane protein YhaH (DUF805 family)
MLSESSPRYTNAVSDTPASNTPTHSAAGAAVCASCGQRVLSDDDRKRKRFFWGLALAWLPFIPVLVGLANALRGMSQQKATGIGAVAGGIAEMGVLYVLTLAPILTISAMVLLLRSLSKAHPLRNILAVISVCWGALMISVLALFFWLVYVKFPQH